MERALKSLDNIEDKCLADALDFVKKTADKYSLGKILEVGGTDKSRAANALVGAVAFDRYKTCVTEARNAGRH